VWLIAERLRDHSGARAARTALMAQQAAFAGHRIDNGVLTLTLLEDRVTALANRLEAIAVPLEAHHTALLATTGQLEATGNRLTEISKATEAATVTLGAATPAAIAQAESLLGLLGTAATNLNSHMADADALLARLHDSAREADAAATAAAAATRAHIETIVSTSQEAQTAMAVPLAQLVEGVDTAFTRTAAAMDATRDGVHAQTNAMLASVEQARVTLDHIGGESARQIDAQLAALRASTGELGTDIEAQADRTNALIEEIARGFAIVDAKLANSATTSNTTLEAIAAKMTEARDAIFRLGEPIAATETALAGVESRIALMGDAAASTFGSLDTALPAALPRIDDMAMRLSELHDRADQLSLPLQSGGNSIAAAQAQLDRARESLETAATQLGEELAAARDALSEIDTLTGSASLAASTQLIDVFARVREIANQTAGTMRETLSNVVAEAEAALDQAGSSRAESAFATPIRASLAEVEVLHDRVAAASQAAAERVTQRLLALTETVAGVENRIDEVDTRFDVRTRDTLTKRAGQLVDSLNKATIDIAGLLSFEIEDTAWDNYLGGDKSIFVRRVADRLDSSGTRAIARHFHHDLEFRSQATHFIQEFEQLIAHVLPDREGHALAVTLLSSHIGRLYTALGQSIDRFA
ncbi:MAG: hypothetical protein RL490_2602, partial [Pseudomonadota bacterium]